jgi:hypothetical protein
MMLRQDRTKSPFQAYLCAPFCGLGRLGQLALETQWEKQEI